MSEFDACPFERDIHHLTPTPNSESEKLIMEMKTTLEQDSSDLLSNHKNWLTDECYMRFLIARDFKVDASLVLIKTALEWRQKRKPDRIEDQPAWMKRISYECTTGKVYCPDFDRWGRPVLVFDNTVQNTSNWNDHMEFLAWNLEFATRLMKPKVVDKYLIFMHLKKFSIFNTPPWASTRETIQMLCDCFPERMGHCIAYQPPAIFRTFFNTVKGFLDPKTVSKVVFIIGDVSPGSENDQTMCRLVGDKWRDITGAEQEEVLSDPVTIEMDDVSSSQKGQLCSPGYNHNKYWLSVKDRLEALADGSLHASP